MVGRIYAVSMCKPPFKSSGRTAAQKFGVRYEKKVQKELRELLAPDFIHTGFAFFDDSGYRICVPDGIYIHHKLQKAAIFEIKSRHTSDAWWQLRKLYEPVARAFYSNYTVLPIEICRSYDAATPFPEKVELVTKLKDFIFDAADGTLGVLPWRL